jgi:integrase
MASIRKRKAKDGTVSYTVQIRRKGHESVNETFSRKEDAEKWAREREIAIERGTIGTLTEAQRRTVAQAIERYLAEVNGEHKDAATRAQQLTWWNDRVGTLSLAGVTPAVLSDCKSALQREPYTRTDEEGAREYKRSGSTVNRYMAALSHVLTYCVTEWQWIVANPMRAVKKLKEPRGRDRYLSEEELPRLLAECQRSLNPHLHTIVQLGILTGARKNELRTLTWKQVDLKKKRVTVHKTKNDDVKVLHLSAPAVALIEAHGKVRRLETDLLFPSAKNPKQPTTITRAWKSTLKRAKVANFRFHDLRHTAGSYLAMSGASDREIAEVLGHRTLQMVKRYSHLSEKHTSNVVERMANTLPK